jgi:hypothetical protein
MFGLLMLSLVDDACLHSVRLIPIIFGLIFFVRESGIHLASVTKHNESNRNSGQSKSWMPAAGFFEFLAWYILNFDYQVPYTGISLRLSRCHLAARRSEFQVETKRFIPSSPVCRRQFRSPQSGIFGKYHSTTTRQRGLISRNQRFQIADC